MSEPQFAKRLMRETGRDGDESDDTARSKQRQVGAFSLEVEYRDGRSGEGFSWADYRGHAFGSDGEREWVKVLFGTRLLTMSGYDMDTARHDIRSGQLTSIRELSSREVMLLRQHNPHKEPIVESITVEPAFDEIEKEIKGEKGSDTGFARSFAELVKAMRGERDEHDTGWTGKVRG